MPGTLTAQYQWGNPRCPGWVAGRPGGRDPRGKHRTSPSAPAWTGRGWSQCPPDPRSSCGVRERDPRDQALRARASCPVLGYTCQAFRRGTPTRHPGHTDCDGLTVLFFLLPWRFLWGGQTPISQPTHPSLHAKLSGKPGSAHSLCSPSSRQVPSHTRWVAGPAFLSCRRT